MSDYFEGWTEKNVTCTVAEVSLKKYFRSSLDKIGDKWDNKQYTDEDQFQIESFQIESKLAKHAEGLYRDYLDQALLQLSITYQKSRDYDMAQDICRAFMREEEKENKEKDILTDVSSYLDDDSPLYMVQYLDENEWDKWKAGSENSVYGDLAEGRNREGGESKNTRISEILKAMEKIWEILDCLENRMAGQGILGLQWNTDTQGTEAKKLIRNFVAGCLNEVRFLVKASEYSYEEEVRMVHHSYEPKIDEENFEVPRLYIEVDRDIQIGEIKLGPKVGDSQANEIVTWLSKTKRVANITKSGRHYK